VNGGHKGGREAVVVKGGSYEGEGEALPRFQRGEWPNKSEKGQEFLTKMSRKFATEKSF